MSMRFELVKTDLMDKKTKAQLASASLTPFHCQFAVTAFGLYVSKMKSLSHWNNTTPPQLFPSPPPLWPNPLHPQLYILAGWPSAHWRAVPGVLLILLFDCLAHLHAAGALLSVCENQPRKMCKWAHNVNVAIVQNGEPARTMDTSR